MNSLAPDGSKIGTARHLSGTAGYKDIRQVVTPFSTARPSPFRCSDAFDLTDRLASVFVHSAASSAVFLLSVLVQPPTAVCFPLPLAAELSPMSARLTMLQTRFLTRRASSNESRHPEHPLRAFIFTRRLRGSRGSCALTCRSLHTLRAT